MLIGVAFYSLIIGIVSAYFTAKDDKTSLLNKKLLSIEEFGKSLGIRVELQEKMKERIQYGSGKLAYLWLKPSEDIFSELSTQLKYEFLVALHQRMITKCEFFMNKDLSFIVRVVPLMKPMFIKAGEIIWSPGDFSSSGRLFSDSVIMILEGVVSLYFSKPHLKNQAVAGSRRLIGSQMIGKAPQTYTFIKDGKKVEINDQLFLLQEFGGDCYLGEIDLFNKRRRTHYAIAKTDIDIMVLSKIDLEDVIVHEFPHVCADLKRVSDVRMKTQVELINEIERLINMKEKQVSDRNDLTNRSSTSMHTNEVVDKYREMTVEAMYKQSIESFPIEDMIQANAALQKDIDKNEVVDRDIDVLITMFQGSVVLIRMPK